MRILHIDIHGGRLVQERIRDDLVYLLKWMPGEGPTRLYMEEVHRLLHWRPTSKSARHDTYLDGSIRLYLGTTEAVPDCLKTCKRLQVVAQRFARGVIVAHQVLGAPKEEFRGSVRPILDTSLVASTVLKDYLFYVDGKVRPVQPLGSSVLAFVVRFGVKEFVEMRHEIDPELVYFNIPNDDDDDDDVFSRVMERMRKMAMDV